jgi:hypothetical protein
VRVCRLRVGGWSCWLGEGARSGEAANPQHGAIHQSAPVVSPEPRGLRAAGHVRQSPAVRVRAIADRNALSYAGGCVTLAQAPGLTAGCWNSATL